MRKKDLAYQIRTNLLNDDAFDAEEKQEIEIDSDDNIIKYAITCPCCGEPQVNEIELIVAINEAKNAKHFFEICNQMADKAIEAKDNVAKEQWTELKMKSPLPLEVESLHALYDAFIYERKKYHNFDNEDGVENRKKYNEIVNKCNQELYNHFDIGDLKPFLVQFSQIHKKDFVLTQLVNATDFYSGELIPVDEVKENIIQEIKEKKFRDNAMYSYITFTHEIFDYFFAGDFFDKVHSDKSILKDMDKVEDMVKLNHEHGGVVLPKLREEIEKQFGGTEFLGDHFQLGQSEVTLYWYLPIDKGHEVLLNVNKFLEQQPYGKTVT